MPGSTTVQAYPYPYQKEAATPVSVQNFATEVDTELTAADVQRAIVLNRPTARVTRASGSQSVPINVGTVLTFDTAEWDTAGWYSAGTPNRLTFTQTGLYALVGSMYALFAANTDTYYELALNVSATPVARQKKRQYGAGGVTDSRAVAVGVLYRITAGQFVDLRAFWSGSAGAAQNITNATLGARLVCLTA
jgi:hypothetical protein